MQSWQFQKAKARLSEVLRSSVKDGPQEITVRGKPAAVVLAWADYQRLQRRKPSFVSFLRRSPLVGVDLGLERDKTPVRDLEL